MSTIITLGHAYGDGEPSVESVHEPHVVAIEFKQSKDCSSAMWVEVPTFEWSFHDGEDLVEVTKTRIVYLNPDWVVQIMSGTPACAEATEAWRESH